MTLARTKTAIVKVLRGFPEDPADQVPAVIVTRNGRKEETYLSPETKEAMGSDLFAFFEAERVDNRWWLGERVENGARGW